MSGVPYLFASASGTLPLSQLDTNFSTPVTIGTTSVALGNTVTTLAGLTLSNPTISTPNFTTNVGIGTSSPSSLLQIVGATDPVLTVTAASSGSAWLSLNGISSAVVHNPNNVPTIFTTNGTERMRITAAGNVGIGTSNPDSFYGNAVPLAVVKNQNAATIFGVGNSTVGTSAVAQINMIGGTGYSYVNMGLADNNGSPYFTNDFGSAVNYAKWGFGGNERMRITASGNLGIGAAPPTTGSALLYVLGDAVVPPNNAFSFNTYYTSGFNAWQTGYAGLIKIDGSGNMVFDNSASSASAGALITLSERMRITATGNVGIGTSSPVSPLTVNGPGAATPSLSATGGAVTISNNNDLDLQIGETSTTGSTGIYLQSKRHTNDGTSWQLYLNPLGGSVGIGTSAPGYLLHVAGNGYFNTAVGINQDPTSWYSFTPLLVAAKTQNAETIIGIGNGTSGTSAATTFKMIGGTANSTVDMRLSDNNGSPYFTNDYGLGVNYAKWGFGGTERMRITAAGNVGIGNSSPTTKLTVSGSGFNGGSGTFISTTSGNSVAVNGINAAGVNDSAYIYLTDGTNAAYAGLTAQNAPGTVGSLRFGVAGTEYARIQPNGNVGIGTTTPDINLRVSGTYAEMGTLDGTVDSRLASTSGGGAGIVGTYSNNPMTFYSNGTERMRISALGNVGIGTSNPDSFYGNAVPLAVVKNQNAVTTFGIANGTSGSLAFTQIAMVGGTSNSFANLQLADNSGSPYFQLTTGSAVSGISMIANSNGVKLAINGTSWTSLSDARLKDIIEPITNAASKVSTLRSVIGKFKTEADGVRRPFLMAQDVQAVLPEAVNVAKDAMGTLELSYTDVIPLLVAAINELTARITTLEAKGT